MTGKGHTLCGIAFCAAPSVIAFNHSGVIPAVLAALFCIIGATAPDWMEIRRTVKGGGSYTLIPHRTITHIISVWAALVYWSYSSLLGTTLIIETLPLIDSTYAAASTFGFACGGLIHLLGDIPNKQKIPILTLWDGIALNLWKSGKNETFMVILTAVLAIAIIANETGLKSPF
ncbi:conserved membrane hypothetical protein [Vibrio chagasii]|nr:conserved membrane hypothetical protein [Vibrio chagasii]